jgi:hypothetical protein
LLTDAMLLSDRLIASLREEGQEVNQETIEKVADASGEIAKTMDTGLILAGKFGSFFKGTLDTTGKMLENEIRFIAAKRSVRLSDKWNQFMDARMLSAPTRPIPPNFALPLFTAAVLEEDDELQDTWARLLVNAGDAATPMELRSAYVEILRGMSAADVRNLAMLAELSLRYVDKGYAQPVATDTLPGGGDNHGETGGTPAPISSTLGISLNNLSRLGCIIPASGWGGVSFFHMVNVTHLGMALYRACS